jgi:hypothetical protein
MICAFYSAERKTGRSMAMANVGALLHQRGERVIVADWNLDSDSPGLERLFPAAPQITGDSPGLIELLIDYCAELSRPVSGASDDVRLPTDALECYVTSIPGTDSSHGQLFLMTAGRHDSSYAERVASFDWERFFSNLDGARLIERLRRRLRYLADVTLIDVSAGVTPLSAVCLSLVADVVIMFCPVGTKSLNLTQHRAQQLTAEKLHDLRGERPLHLVIVPALIEYGEAQLLNEFKASFVQRFEPLIPLAIRGRPEAFWRLKVPKIPYFAYRPSIVVGPPGEAIAEPLVEAYERLTDTLKALSTRDGVPRNHAAADRPNETDAMDLDRFRALRIKQTETPSVFISYAREDQASAHELWKSLTAFGFKAWIDTEGLLGGEEWERTIEEQIATSDFVLICLSQRSVEKKGHFQKEMKKTLEVVQLQPEGTVYLIPVRLDNCTIPPSLKRFQCIDLFEQNGLAKLEQSIRNAWRQSRAHHV